ncbi:MAG TPA: hypothetical protein VGN95_14600 [Pyrinomonadaceae bacterium]|jgi:hypothetical protein|nr:hypothetical protein [Pyrinomonadaceae bacterium]
MRKNDKPKTKKTTRKSDPLAEVQRKQAEKLQPYADKAAELIFLLFDDEDIPDFVVDVVQSWLTELENRTHIFWNRRSVLQVAIPLMLQEAVPNPADLDKLFDRNSSVSLSAFNDSLDTNDTDGDFPLTAMGRLVAEDKTDQLQAELEGDAEALARLIHSKHTPAQLRARLLEAMDDVRLMDDAPEVIKVAYPLAVRKLQEAEGSASDE